MGDLFRGEEMTLCQIYFQAESVYSCVSQLGELGIVQFRDLNPNVNLFQRRFVNEVRRCEEMERKLRFIEKEIEKETDIQIDETSDHIEAPKPKEMIDLESSLESLEHDLQEVNMNKDALKKNFLELKELKHVLSKASYFLEEQDRQRDVEGFGAPVTALNMDTDRGQSLRLCFITGVISREKVPPFELMLWRICRGNVFLRTADIEEQLEDPNTGETLHKTVFILFFQGDQLRAKVKKICDAFRATIYPCPETTAERREMALGVLTRLEELTTVLDQSLRLRKGLLVNAAKSLKTWFCRVRKMKAIYHTMNLFNLEVNQKCLIAECWAPVNELTRISLALNKGTELSGGSVPSILNRMNTREQPPTHHRTNKFTQGFQNLVDAYGIASYREFNPAPFTVITFPFLFAVMFGDAGHGLIMLLFGLFLVLKEKSLTKAVKGNEVFEIFFGGRYLILLMSIFSIYTGLIYNDVFSKSLNIFGSSWRVNLGDDFNYENISQLALNPNPHPNLTAQEVQMYEGNPYPIGFDPVWALAINKISYVNSFKMKFSVIIGIMQMVFGLSLSLFNHLYFNNSLSLFFEFIPQIIFITLIFVYLCIMIFIKWIKYEGSSDSLYGSNCAPNLLIELINMFFFSTTATPEHECYALYPGQGTLQKALIVVAVLCIPVMLIVKPTILYLRNKKKSQYGSRLADTGHINVAVSMDHDDDFTTRESGSINNLLADKSKHHEHEEEEAGIRLDEDVRDYIGATTTTSEVAAETITLNGYPNESDSNLLPSSLLGDDDYTLHDSEFDMTEVAVEQCIHTIEYFLGCVSHTASYLRLWALSLAHAQLSEVLWHMVLRMGLSMTTSFGFVVLFGVFAGWAVFTVGVLILMEGLSAFLHALRLHWVEFQSKFYKGEGYAFVPFSFDSIMDNVDTVEK